MGRTVLVTGATGFAGSHLMELLLEAGYTVRVLIRRTSDLRWIPQDRVTLVTADVRDAASLRGLVSNTSWVFHFGGITRARSEAEFFEVNTKGTVRLAEAFCASGPQDGLFLFCSSLAASGPAPAADRPRIETDRPRPISAYGDSKLAAEVQLGETLADHVRLVIVRPPTVYGPRDDAILTFFRWAIRGWLPLPAPALSRVSMIHARDLARCCLTLASGDAAGIYHVSDGQTYSWEEVGAVAGRAVGRRLRPLRIPAWFVRLVGVAGEGVGRLRRRVPVVNRSKVRDMLQPYWICDSAKARQAGWSPQIDLEEGLRETVDWYRNEGWLK